MESIEPLRVAGFEVPRIGLGTAPMTGKTCRSAVSAALDIGYRHIDTAQMYDNETEVGRAIEGSDVDRDEIVITTKLQRDNLEPTRVYSSFDRSFDRLGLEYVDLLLIHAPNPTVPIHETISAMNELQDDGRVRYIGVSNFSSAQLDEAVRSSDRPIVTNQVKYNPFHHQTDLLLYCIDRDVVLTAYTPLAKGRVATDDTLQTIGARYGKTGAQVALRWLVQQPNVIAIPKASSAAHLQENVDVFDFDLHPEEMTRIFEIGGRVSNRLRSIIEGE